MFGTAARLSVRPLTPISRDVISPYSVRDFNETCHTFSSCERALGEGKGKRGFV